MKKKLHNCKNNLCYRIGDYIYTITTNQLTLILKKLIKYKNLFNILFGEDYKIILNIPFNNCLIYLEYINQKLRNDEDILKLERYLIKLICDNRFFNNIFEDGLPLDPVTMEPISEEDRIIIGNACFSRRTIRDLIYRNILN